MQKRMTISLTVLFFIIAIAVSTVAFPDDRMVVKIAMFAIGIAVGMGLAGVLNINNRQTNPELLRKH